MTDGTGVLGHLGYPSPKWNGIWKQYSPDKVELYFEWTRRMLENKELEPKVRELIIVAIDAVIAWPSPFIDIHINEAFREGATIQELVETMETVGYLMGPHALNHGFTSLEAVIEARKADGLPVPRSREQAS